MSRTLAYKPPQYNHRPAAAHPAALHADHLPSSQGPLPTSSHRSLEQKTLEIDLKLYPSAYFQSLACSPLPYG